jgi:choloylglycine hydrolase
VSDHKRLIYFVESALTPNTFWVSLKEIGFLETGKLMKLDLGKDQRNVYSGDAVKDFKVSEPFHFLGLQ